MLLIGNSDFTNGYTLSVYAKYPLTVIGKGIFKLNGLWKICGEFCAIIEVA
jgi:hypothetical protein